MEQETKLLNIARHKLSLTKSKEQQPRKLIMTSILTEIKRKRVSFHVLLKKTGNIIMNITDTRKDLTFPSSTQDMVF